MKKFRTIKRKLTLEECKNIKKSCSCMIEMQNEMIDYWKNKNTNQLSKIDSFIFNQSGFNTIDDYIEDCKTMIEYNKDKIVFLDDKMKNDFN